jgi:GNAT superfamily N-acetyltransferase
MQPPEVRPICQQDLPSATASAARAFYDDPVLGWFQRDLLRQQRQFPAAFKAAILDAMAAGEVWVAVVDGRARGVAAWLSPGSYPRSPRRDLRLAVRSLRAFMPPSLRAVRYGISLVLAIERVHPRTRHWYLGLLAVDPLLQGRGLGSALLEPVLTRADDEGNVAYLETQKPENVTWYARSGFAVSEELRIGPCPPVWGLLREPKGEHPVHGVGS